MGKDRGLKFSTASKKALQSWRWPGNVRELENAITRAVVCAAADSIEPGDLPPEVVGAVSAREVGGETGWWSMVSQVAGEGGDLLAAGEKILIEKALREADGNVKRAAEVLGVTRAALRTRVERYKLHCNTLQ